jgi:hypothetical protein
MDASRRRWVTLAVISCAASAAPRAFAQGGPAHVDEADEQAVALGYKHDTTKVDAARYPKHDAKQHCGNCSFFQGKAGDPWAGCAMFGRKHIAANGWCTAWAKVP